MSRSVDVTAFVRSLERWVQLQRTVLEMFRDLDPQVRQSDRLDIIIHTRIAFNHMIRTLKAFDDWLQDPFISSNIPRELLIDVWDTTMKMMELLLELDIRHTSSVKDIIEEKGREGKLNPLLSHLRDIGREREEGRGSSMSI